MTHAQLVELLVKRGEYDACEEVCADEGVTLWAVLTADRSKSATAKHLNAARRRVCEVLDRFKWPKTEIGRAVGLSDRKVKYAIADVRKASAPPP